METTVPHVNMLRIVAVFILNYLGEILIHSFKNPSLFITNL